MSEVISIDGLIGSRAGFLLSYPRFDEERAMERLGELRGLGVMAVELRGRHMVEGVPVLGKGHVGVVLAARVGGRPAALKVRRVDSNRGTLEKEAEHLRVANGVSVGPRLIDVSWNFLLMELIEGEYLVDWVGGLGPEDVVILGRVIEDLLDRAHRLDLVGLDHGELSSAHRHVMVAGGVPRIIDFESASTGRRCSNVTSVTQYLFFNRRMQERVGRVLGLPERGALLEALAAYKSGPSRERLGALKLVLGLVE
ncbi:MAG: serine/threonine protein kinase [Candidatus Bathyarchaeota archaeon]|nr:MAG: serine/threonine protein kinase [Candidatus Bathyarchaeota archaeon]